MKKFYLNLFLFSIPIFISFYTNAQTYNISGYVYDAQSGESIIGAYIFEGDSTLLTSTNNFGYYNIKLSEGRYILHTHFIGYQDTSIYIILNENTTVDFYVKGVELQTVIINADVILKDKLNTVPLSVTELKQVTQLGGEPDLMKALTLAPGISTAGEGLSKIVVRGGEADQNLIKLDGATVYNSSHAFGFVSIFNADAIKSVKVYKGGFPARYGGRLSSVLDFNMYDGNKKIKTASYSIGTVTSHLFFEGPIKKDTSSYMFAARASYLGLFVLPLKASFLNGKIENYSNYWLYDINGKVNFRAGNNGRLFLSLYTGHDYYYKVSKIFDDEFSNSISRWGNVTSNIRYTNQLNGNLFLSTGISYNNYKSNFILKNYADPLLTNLQSKTDQSSAINDVNLNLDLSTAIFKNDQINFGVEINPIALKPISYDAFETDSLFEIYNNSNIGNANVFNNAIYAEYNWNINDKMEVIAGVRQIFYNNNNYKQTRTEPRLVYNYSPNNKYAISFSYATMNQFVNLLNATQVGFQEEIYVAANPYILPQSSSIVTAGFNRNLFHNKFYFSAETYYKEMKGLTTLKPGVSSLKNNVNNIEDITATNGIGKSYGAEFLLKKQYGKFTGWIEYTLSWDYRKFPDLNNNEWFRSRYDRRHDFGITGSYNFSNNWNVNATWVYVTGQPLTVPDAIYQDPYGQYYFHIPSINNGKLPDYHRLDFSFTHNKITKNQNNSAWSFGMYNAYGRINPVYEEYFLKETKDEAGNIVKVESVLRTTTLFRFLPYLTYSWKWSGARKFY